MSLSRRDFLKLGGAALVVVAGGSVFRAVDQGMFSVGRGPAYEPWTNWRDAPTAPERIVAAGILASNPHNSQPWLFHITDSAIDLYAVPARQIGVIDPFRREMYIGLGCALENMHLAAQTEGFSLEIALLPNAADETHAAHLSLTPDANAHANFPLYAAIPSRHTNRAPYDTFRPLTPEQFAACDALVTEPDVRLFWFKDEAARAQFGEVAIDAAEALIADKQQSIDSHLWWRQDWDQVQESADGITLDAQGLGELITNLAKFLPDLSRQQGDQTFVKNVREIMIPTAAAFGILAVPNGMDNASEAAFRQRLNCGRAWQRMHLWGTTQGLAMQPLNQMCERDDRERHLGQAPVIGDAVRALVGENARAIMPFRVGYPTLDAFPSPRRGLGQVIEEG